MQINRHSQAKWQGNITEGTGEIALGSNLFTGPYSFKERTSENTIVTNPEELIAAAHAGCFSMALSAELSKVGYHQIDIKTIANVNLSKTATGFAIASIDLVTEVADTNIDLTVLKSVALNAKVNCPISKALAAVSITLKLNGEDLV